MKRPSFQFYPGDWQSNSNLRRCTHAEKGVWLDVMCILHDQPEYGVLRWPLKEIAQAVGCSAAVLKALVGKGVLKGDDRRIEEPYIYVPRSGRKDGEPVTLLATQDGPVWYSSRMVRDEYVRTIRGESTRFGEGSGDALRRSPKPPFGDGSSSPSSSSPSGNTEAKASSSAGKLPTCPTQGVIDLYHEVLPMLPAVRLQTESRRKAIRKVWDWTLASLKTDNTRRAETAEQALEWFRSYFQRATENDFLMGRTPRSGEHANWKCDLDFLLTERGMKHVIEKTNVEEYS